MKISDEAIKEFAQIWAEEHNGVMLTDAELKKAAETVLRAIKAVYDGRME